MINSLTPEQEAKIPEYYEKWKKIGEEYQPIDQEKAIELLKVYCAKANIHPKKFKFFDSPDACQRAIHDEHEPNEPFKYYDLSWYQLGNINVSYCNFYDFLIEEVKEPPADVKEIWDIFKEVSTELHMFWIVDDTVYASEKPTELHYKENRLHNINGPAVLYKDNMGMYVVEGVVFKKAELKSLNADKILEEQNAEKRMAMISYYSIDRFMKEINPKTIEEILGKDLYQKYPIKRYYQQGDVIFYNEKEAKNMVYAELSDEMKEKLKRITYKLVKIPKLNYNCLIMDNPSIEHKHFEFVPENISSVFDAIMYRNQDVNPEALPAVLT